MNHYGPFRGLGYVIIPSLFVWAAIAVGVWLVVF